MDPLSDNDATSSDASTPSDTASVSTSSTSSRDEQLFTRFFIVGLFGTNGSRIAIKALGTEAPEDFKLEAIIIDQYPPSSVNDSMTKSIPQFCFPEKSLFNLSITSEMFVFVVTDANGDRQYGFCRRRIPRKNNRELLPECLCILSYNPWFCLFEAMLEVIENRRETIERRRDAAVDPLRPFLQAVLAHPFPAPGDQFRVRVSSEHANLMLPMTYNFQRPDETATGLHHVDFSDLFSNFDEKAIFGIFISVLRERRLIFYSSSLSRLTGCVHAAVNLIYPFSWQHIFIPVLPSSLLDYVHAPMPFVVGIHSSLRATVERLDINEAVLVDIDAHTCSYFPDDMQLLPENLLARLRFAIRDYLPKPQDKQNVIGRKLDQVSNVAISEAFLAFLVAIFGNFHKYFNEHHVFQQEKFKLEQPKNIQPFLEQFAASQMYEQFLASRSARRKLGLEIQFKTKVQSETRFERLAASSFMLRSRALDTFKIGMEKAKVSMDRFRSQSGGSQSRESVGASPFNQKSSWSFFSPKSDAPADGFRAISRNSSGDSVNGQDLLDRDDEDSIDSTKSLPVSGSKAYTALPTGPSSSSLKPKQLFATNDNDFGSSLRNDFRSALRIAPQPSKTTSPTKEPQRSVPIAQPSSAPLIVASSSSSNLVQPIHSFGIDMSSSAAVTPSLSSSSTLPIPSPSLSPSMTPKSLDIFSSTNAATTAMSGASAKGSSEDMMIDFNDNSHEKSKAKILSVYNSFSSYNYPPPPQHSSPMYSSPTMQQQQQQRPFSTMLSPASRPPQQLNGWSVASQPTSSSTSPSKASQTVWPDPFALLAK